MIPFFTITDRGLRLAVRLTPRAGRSVATGVMETPGGKCALAIRIAAPPVEGAANDELIGYLAKAIRLPKSAVHILSGDSSRLKILHLDGDGRAIADRIEQLLASSQAAAKR